MTEEIELTIHQRALKQAFKNLMVSENENDHRVVLISLLEDAKKSRRRDVTVEAPCARMEIKTTK